MSRIDQLIAEQCPGGVEYRTLGSLGDWYGGGTPSKSRPDYWAGGTIPWISPKDMGRPIVDSTEDHITAAAVKESATRLVPAGSVAMVVRSSILDRILPIALVPTSAALNQDMKAVVPRRGVLPEYIAHLLRSRGNAILRVARKAGGSVASIDSGKLFSFSVPVPPIAVQREIVGILDTFTGLEAGLEAELDARRRQYEHYRRALLHSSKLSGSWELLGDVANVRVGQAPGAGTVTESGPFRFINAGATESGWTQETNTPAETVTIPSRGQGGVGIVGYQSEPFWCGPLCYRVRSATPRLQTRFMYHFLKFIQPSIRDLQQTGGTPALNRKELVTVKVRVPPVDEQERIVDSLDALDALVNDISVGLPAELAARRRQYEYYRDKLLTFEELV